MDIDRFTEILGERASLLPPRIFEGLNLGIGVSEEVKHHELSRPDKPRHILGEYRVSRSLGRGIMLFYGSFRAVFPYASDDVLQREIDRVLKHELTHHLESQAGSRELEFADAKHLID